MTYLPCNIQLIVPHKVRVVTFQGVQNKRFISLGDLCIGESSLVRQIHLRRHSTGVQAGGFGVQFEVHGLGGLDADDQFVAGDVLEDALCDVFELDADFDFGFVQG